MTHVIVYSKYVGYRLPNPKPEDDFLFTLIPIDEFEPRYGDIYWRFI